MFYCKELNKEFECEKELFAELKANKEQIISLKMARPKWSDGISIQVMKKDEAEKAGIKDLEDGYIYPVINTTKVLDSHKDLHIDGIWKKTVKEQKGKIHYTTNHELKIGSIVAYPKDVEAYTETIPWSAVGKNYEGNTEALIFKVKVQDYANEDALKAIEHKLPVQNSVRMVYYKIEMAINSDDDDYKSEKAVFDKYEPLIANKAEFEKEIRYFWVVKEAGISKEGSMVPIGSNQATPILYPENKEDEPTKVTQEEKAEKPSLSDENKAFLEAINRIINN